MKFAQILNKIMDKRHISAYKISKETGISDRLIGYWRKGEKLPGAENLLTLANYFSISTDYLLTGEEKSSSSSELKDDEQEIVNIYRELTDWNKARLTERGQSLLEQQQTKIQRAYMVARSTDNAPPKIVEGDFSDVLNAPDATDEY